MHTCCWCVAYDENHFGCLTYTCDMKIPLELKYCHMYSRTKNEAGAVWPRYMRMHILITRPYLALTGAFTVPIHEACLEAYLHQVVMIRLGADAVLMTRYMVFGRQSWRKRSSALLAPVRESLTLPTRCKMSNEATAAPFATVTSSQCAKDGRSPGCPARLC